MSNTEQKCICGHADFNHIVDTNESICCAEGCPCKRYHRWEVILQDPTGEQHVIPNVGRFVRENEHLFEPADAEVRTLPCGKSFSTACTALLHLAEEAKGIQSWKGWTLMTKAKTFKA